MTKPELIAKIAEKGGLTKTSAGEVLELVCGTVAEILVEEGVGASVSLPEIGKIEVVQAGEKTCKNFQTGEPMVIPAHGAIKFKAKQALKDAVK